MVDPSGVKLADAPAPHDVSALPVASSPDLTPPPELRSRRLIVGAVFLLLVAAFSWHLSAFGSWLVDDAGISFAYAVNLAHGHGLVSAVGRTPVEGFSNPAWVVLFALLTKLGLFGRVTLLGRPEYVVVTKALAVALHGVVLACLAVVIRRVLTVVRGSPPSLGLFAGCWAATGLLLAANPSYVIWMGSGLENPLLAAVVVAIAAVATTAVPQPSARAMVGLGVLAGLAALTRPDGAIYAVVIVAVPLLTPSTAVRRRVRLVLCGAAAFACVFGAYLVFRVLYFGMLVPNTAVAKSQTLPTAGDLGRLLDIPNAFGGAVALVGAFGCVAAVVLLRRNRNGTALRVIGAGLVPLLAAVAAYLVLAVDWMGELRFLTPAWPLLSVAAVLGGAQLLALAETGRIRAAIAVVLLSCVVIAAPEWGHRTQSFRASPTAPLCVVATGYGRRLEATARALARDDQSLSVAVPDIGGVLLATDVHVVDIGGLVNRRIARLLKEGDSAGIARYVLDEVRPTVILDHAPWTRMSGLTASRLRPDYVDVDHGREWVRREALERLPDPDATLARITERAARFDGPFPETCGRVLFG